MIKVIFLLACVFVPLFVAGDDTSARSVCSGMLADFKVCFSGEVAPAQLIDEWKWGSIRFAFNFNFAHVTAEDRYVCSIFAACPGSAPKETNSFFTEPPVLRNFCWYEGPPPYLMFGIKTRKEIGKQSLVFVYCSKQSDIYSDFIKTLNLHEPSYEEAQAKYPAQCWDTTIYDKQSFLHSQDEDEGLRIDDQFIHWGILSPEIDVVHRFNRGIYFGVMLVKRDPPSPLDEAPEIHRQTGVLDLSKFTEDFTWIPKHQLERFSTRLSSLLARDKEDIAYHSTYTFSRVMLQHADNNGFVRSLGVRHSGIVRTMSDPIPDVPWKEFSYYKSTNGVVTLRNSIARSYGGFDLERFHSFVLDMERIDEGADILLPNGLDIKPYLHSYPSENILYEHARADKRSRIIVQPYIAYLYEDGRLVKALVCRDKNGPADHGWSLVRGYYCYEGMAWYYWPVQRAYSPLGD